MLIQTKSGLFKLLDFCSAHICIKFRLHVYFSVEERDFLNEYIHCISCKALQFWIGSGYTILNIIHFILTIHQYNKSTEQINNLNVSTVIDYTFTFIYTLSLGVSMHISSLVTNNLQFKHWLYQQICWQTK